MKVLILDWRDPKNPKRGGAEIVMARYAQHWISKGHEVWWLANKFPGSLSVEEVKNLQVIRIGPSLPYHSTLGMLISYPLFVLNTIWVGWRLCREINFDITIDAIHGLPMYSFIFATGKQVMWVCEVAGKIWDKMYPFPINLLGKWCEHIIYHLYTNSSFWAISRSTKCDILQIKSDLSVQVVPLGIDTKEFTPLKKFTFPSAIFVARLVKMKGIESAIFATKSIVKKLPNFKLFVVGGGTPEYVRQLHHSIAENNLSANIEFAGSIPDAQRNQLYAKCHFLIHTSFKEGFGLTVLEAAASGTPTIARRGSAMDELIKDNNDGLLFNNDTEISDLYCNSINKSTYKRLSKNARSKSLKFDWKVILENSKSVTHI
jgi:glycosyltransferase involved in cell wall biosynthesis